MASLAANITPEHATSLDLSHTIMAREDYQRDDWHILTLNDPPTEDALSKILRFGFDIDRDPSRLGDTKFIKDHGQIIAWAKHIAGDIPATGRTSYDFKFDALYSPDAVPGEDATPIGTEADLVTQISDPFHARDYALQDKDTEKVHLEDHALSLTRARHRQ